jgi:hypothetical protein
MNNLNFSFLPLYIIFEKYRIYIYILHTFEKVILFNFNSTYSFQL